MNIGRESSELLMKIMRNGGEEAAFESKDYLCELKLDGARCVAYWDPVEETRSAEQRNVKMLSKVPELSEIHKQLLRGLTL